MFLSEREVSGLMPVWGGMIPPPGDTRGAEAVGASAFSSSPVAGEKTNYPPDQGELGSQGTSVCMTMVDAKVSP